tara:strand:+ start:2256 stop:2513 length:258 start_codon:yes stop_codon:yes gene_type:complete
MENIEKEVDKRYPTNKVDSIDDAQHNFNVRMERIAFHEGYKYALEQVKNNVVLGDVIKELPKCEHKNITSSDGCDDCLNCGVRNY